MIKIKRHLGKTRKNMSEPKTIKIDNVEYVRKDQYSKAKDLNGLPYKIVRTYSAGVFAGYLESRNGDEVVMRNARRLWYWDGASSLSQLAMEGVKRPDNCKFPCEVDRVELLGVIVILDCTQEAQDSIDNVKVWKEK